jgi:hypothetical protein
MNRVLDKPLEWLSEDLSPVDIIFLKSHFSNVSSMLVEDIQNIHDYMFSNNDIASSRRNMASQELIDIAFRYKLKSPNF